MRSHLLLFHKSTFCIGDIRQLAPVMDTPLYTKIDGATNEMAKKGLRIFQLFDNNVFHLTELVRQQGLENEEFRILLENVATGNFTMADYDRWATRGLAMLLPDEKKDFERTGRFLNLTSVETFYTKCQCRTNGGFSQSQSGGIQRQTSATAGAANLFIPSSEQTNCSFNSKG